MDIVQYNRDGKKIIRMIIGRKTTKESIFQKKQYRDIQNLEWTKIVFKIK